MFPVSRFLCLSAAVALSAGAGFAQNVISAKSGLVHYIEGDVSVAGKAVLDKQGVFAEVKKDEQLETGLGRAEVLLTPGVFLRVGEQSSIRMLKTSLDDTRLELVSGRSMVEADTPMKGNLVTVMYGEYATTFVKHGLYEFQASPAQVKVYSGEAQVTAGGQTVTVHEGRTLFFTAALAQERFDAKDGDSLYRWSKVRSEYLSIANVSAARYSQDLGGGYQTGLQGNGYGYGALGSWAFNNSYGMYTYLPYNGIAYSPFGFAYFSPFTVYQAYSPYYSGYGNSGSGSGSGASSSNRVSHSGVVSSRTPGAGQGSTVASGSSGGSRVGGLPATGGLTGGSASHAGGHGK